MWFYLEFGVCKVLKSLFYLYFIWMLLIFRDFFYIFSIIKIVNICINYDIWYNNFKRCFQFIYMFYFYDFGRDLVWLSILIDNFIEF